MPPAPVLSCTRNRLAARHDFQVCGQAVTPAKSDPGHTLAQPSDSISEHILPNAEARGLTAAGLRAEVLAEELHHMILKAVSHGAGVCAGIDFKAVRDSILVENVVQFAGIHA